MGKRRMMMILHLRMNIKSKGKRRKKLKIVAGREREKSRSTFRRKMFSELISPLTSGQGEQRLISLSFIYFKHSLC